MGKAGLLPRPFAPNLRRVSLRHHSWGIALNTARTILVVHSVQFSFL